MQTLDDDRLPGPTQEAETQHPTALALSSAFLAYLFAHHNTPHTPTSTLLDSIEHALLQIRAPLPALLSPSPISTSFASILSAWLTYRRAILTITDTIDAPRNAGITSIQTRIQRTRWLTSLRQARDGDVTNEHVLCLGFGALQGDKMREDVSVGLKGLDQRLREVGDALGSGEWVSMG
jgi:hypothetical protein